MPAANTISKSNLGMKATANELTSAARELLLVAVAAVAVVASVAVACAHRELANDAKASRTCYEPLQVAEVLPALPHVPALQGPSH